VNAQVELRQLLTDHGAVLIRQKKHLVYRLPNGQNFVTAKTPDNPDVAARNNVHNLRRILGITPPTRGETMSDQEGAVALAAPEPPSATPAVQELPKESLKERIRGAIVVEEQNQERVLAEAQAVERRVNMLKALLPFAEDPTIEASLRGILPIPEQPAPSKPEVPPPPPEAITERVQVTRQLVLAATQTFDAAFTINDVMAMMINGRQVDPVERTRIRSSIATAIVTLYERGQVLKEQEHFGRQQTIWRKVTINGDSHRPVVT